MWWNVKVLILCHGACQPSYLYSFIFSLIHSPLLSCTTTPISINTIRTFSFREENNEDQTGLEQQEGGEESEDDPGGRGCQPGGGPDQGQTGGLEEEGRLRDKEPQVCSEILQTSNFLLSLQRFHLVRQSLLTNLGPVDSQI